MKTKEKTNNNNLIIVLSLFMAMVLLALAFGSKTTGGLLSANEFIAKYHSSPEAMLIDVRTPGEFNTSHIAGAIDIDYESSSFTSEIQKLDKTKTYFIYCRSGNRSSQASVIMRQDGIKNLYELQGGIISSPELLM